MYKKLSKTDEIDARLQREGKVHQLNTEEDLQKMIDMNQAMEQGKYYPDYVLDFCPKCYQMTNHLNGLCQKCKRENDF